MKKKQVVKKEEPELIGNEVGAKFDIAGFKEQLQAYQIWLLGHHLMHNQTLAIAYDCAKHLEQAMKGEIPYNYMDGCGNIQPVESWIEHQWQVKQQADQIWDGIKRDHRNALDFCDIKKKHWWQR